jgi:hypothetical protein
MHKEKIITIAKTALITASLFGFVGVAGAVGTWTLPSSTPPGGNVDAPINVSTASQTKNGALGLVGFANFGTSAFTGTAAFNSAIAVGPAAVPGAGSSMLNVIGKSIFNGTVQITGGAPGSGKVLTSDGAGNASWVTPTTGSTGMTSVVHDATLTGAGTTASPLSVVPTSGGPGGIGGSGTAGYLPKWSSSSALNDSIMQQVAAKTSTSSGTAIRVNGETNTDTLVMGGLVGAAGVAVAKPLGGGSAQVEWRGQVPVYNGCTGGGRDGRAVYMDDFVAGCKLLGYLIATP